jgi:hypothetical protein
MVMFLASYEAIYVYRKLISAHVQGEKVIYAVKFPVLAMLIFMLVGMINCVIDLSLMVGF